MGYKCFVPGLKTGYTSDIKKKKKRRENKIELVPCFTVLKEALGPLLKLDIWHDNQGDSPSWYLKTICVKDLNTGANYTFNCYNWLSAESGDGQIERELTVAENTASFKKTKQDLIEAK